MRWIAAALLLIASAAHAQFNGCPAGFCPNGFGGPASGGTPVWVVNPSNPPDLMFDLTQNLVWTKSSGTTSQASSVLTVSRSSSGMVNDSFGNWTTVAPGLMRTSNLGTLIEEGRTNLLINSNAMLSTGWGVNAATNLGGFASPDGGTNAFQIADNATSSQHALTTNGTTITASSTYTFSIFLKAGTDVNTPRLMVANAGFTNSFLADFNLTTGAVSNGSAVGSGVFTSAYSIVYPNGWVLCVITGALAGTDTQAKPTIYFRSGNAYVGTGTTFFAWQGQLELGTSATSPVTTAASAVTRLQDVLKVTSPPAIGASYTMFTQTTPQSPTSYQQQTSISISDGTGSNRANLRKGPTADTWGLFNGTGGVNTSVLTLNGVPPNNTAKTAGAWAAGDQAISLNGGVIAAMATATLPVSPNTMQIGADGANAFPINGFVAKAGFWASQRVPNAQLQSMTQ